MKEMKRSVKGRLFQTQLLKEIRDSFYYVESNPFGEKRIFLDSASGSLRLKDMVDKVQQELPSYAQFKRIDRASITAQEIVEKAIADLRAFTGASNGQFFFGPSSTQTLFYLVDTILSQSEKNSNVVTTNLDHPATYESTWFFGKKYNLERRVVGFNPKQGSLEIEKILERVDDKTALLAMIHASNITGAIHNLEEITKEARKINPHIFILVDGTQFAPHRAIEMERFGVDAYVFGGYKLFCKKGIAFAYLAPRMAKLPHWQFRGLQEEDWALGTIDEATLAGFSAVVEYIISLGQHFSESQERRQQILAGMENIHSHSQALLEGALWGLDGAKGLLDLDHITVYGLDTKNLENRTSLIGFTIEGMSGMEAAQEYAKRGISISPRLDNVYSKHILDVLGVSYLLRVSMCHYNTLDEIREFLAVTGDLQ